MPDIPPGAGAVLGGGTVSSVRTTDRKARFNEEQVDDSIVTDYRIRSIYESDKHRYMMGMTSPGGFLESTVSFVQLAEPTLLWIVDWTAARSAVPPDVPDSDFIKQQAVLREVGMPAPGDDVGGGVGAGNRNLQDWILLDEHFEPGMITVLGDGNVPLYRISGVYVYGHRRPSIIVENDIKFTRPPWLNTTGISFSMPSSRFKKGLIG